MLGKLLKYDIKALWKMMLPLILSVLGTSVVGTIALRVIVEMSNSPVNHSNSMNNPFSGLFMLSLGMLVFVAVMALIAFDVIATVFILYRYYKNLFTDEGYLTFTLPVTTDQILLSKIINGVLWSVISLIVTIIGGGLIVVLGSGVSWGRIANELIDEIQNILHYMGLNGVLVTVETILSGIFALIYSLLLCYLSITIGSTVARRHKVLASIGIFFGIQFALSIATSFVSFIPTLYMASAVSTTAASWTVHLTAVINLAIQAAVAVGSYFICRAILTRRLNLS